MYYDANLIDLQHHILNYKKNFTSKEELLHHFYKYCDFNAIAPGIVRYIFELKDYYVNEIIERIYSRYKLPCFILSKSMFKTMIEEIICSNNFEIDKWNKTISSESKKIFMSIK